MMILFLGKAINYNMAIPKNKIITWSDVKHFRMSQNLLMHSIIYKTKLLRCLLYTSTISRVNRSLNYGNDGYEMVFSRMDEKESKGE